MQRILDQNEALGVLRGFVIPPRPEVLNRFHEERNRPNPSLSRIAAIITADPGISASIIKTVNSPTYGLGREISSVQEAVAILGISNIDTVVTSLALIAASGRHVSMERFWDTAMDVALISRNLARHVLGVSEADAFTLGMFHDCGLALMMQRTPGYKELLMEANANDTLSLPEREQKRFQTDHTIVGYLVAKAWHLPAHICTAIQMHHDRDLFARAGQQRDEQILSLVAVLKVASYLSHSQRGLKDSNDWVFMRGPVLDYLGISDEEFGEIETEMRENSSAIPQAWISKFATT